MVLVMLESSAVVVVGFEVDWVEFSELQSMVDWVEFSELVVVDVVLVVTWVVLVVTFALPSLPVTQGVPDAKQHEREDHRSY